MNWSNEYNSQETPYVADSSAYPKNVGIKALEVYFPKNFVAQTALESFDGVSAGKYTIGLGQDQMAVCSEREDITSVCLTAVHSLMEKYDIPWEMIGRVEVGTESLVDKSKAVKTSLMRLWNERGIYDVEGIDTTNACYGGTAALLNSLAWVESSAWTGKYAIVLAGDIAVYEPGPARPTGGAGVVAMLVGPDAPLVVERGLRSSAVMDVYDFYKPKMTVETPLVDGHLSNACYLEALDRCYNGFADRFQQLYDTPFDRNSFDHAVFHMPYFKLVSSSFGRYLWNDFKRNPEDEELAPLREFAELSEEESYTDRGLIKGAVKLSQEQFDAKVQPGTELGKRLGNSYCGSLYVGLCSLINQQADALVGSRVLMFSYGSGLAATMFSLRVDGSVEYLKSALDIDARLDAREEVTPEVYTDMMAQRAETFMAVDYEPQAAVEDLKPGTYYLKEIDSLHRRQYERRTYMTSALPNMNMMAPALSLRRARVPAVTGPAGLGRSLAMGGLRALRLLR